MSTKTAFLGLVAALALSACSSTIGMRTPSFSPVTTGKLYMAPPRDMTHDGQTVAGSGAEFQALLETWIAKFAPSLEIVTSSGDRLGHEEPADMDVVLEEAAAAGADRALVIVLGNMRDAAPMTFRQDFITVDTGKLVTVPEGKLHWSVAGYVVASGNIGNYHGLLNTAAKVIAYNITQP